MQKNRQKLRLWTIVGAVNILGLIYPLNLLHRAESTDQTLFATFALIGFLLLLIVIDAVSIVVAGVIGKSKP